MRIEIQAKKGGWLDEYFPSLGNEYSNSAGPNGVPAKMPSTKKESAAARTIQWRELNITKDQSSKWQKLASIPDVIYQTPYIEAKICLIPTLLT